MPERSGDDWSSDTRAFGAVASQVGLSADQSQRFLDLVGEMTPNMSSPLLEVSPGGDKQWNVARVTRELQSTWGADFDANMQHVKAAVKRGGEKLEAFLDDTGAGNSPVVLNILALVGKTPDILDAGKAKARLEKLMENGSPYWAGQKMAVFEAHLLRALITPRQ